jgi:hypothetical protein
MRLIVISVFVLGRKPSREYNKSAVNKKKGKEKNNTP